jgi:methionine synthase II (cobalamin-independent)
MILLNIVTLKDFKQDISDSLKQSELVKMFSFINLDEHSDQQIMNVNMSKKDLVVGYTEKIKLEVLISENQLNMLEQLLTNIKGLEANSYSWTTEIKNLRLFKKQNND